jgi:hypothetical protein
MGDEQQRQLGVANVGQRTDRLDHETSIRGDEGGPQRIRADLVDLEDHAVVPHVAERIGEVLAVLAARRVGGVGARRDDDNPVEPAGGGVSERVGQEGRRVAVTPEDGNVDPPLFQLGLEGVDQRAVLVVDRAAAAESLVVVGHLLEPLVGDAATRCDPAQEGHDLVRGLWAAEGKQEDGVIGRERLGSHHCSLIWEGCGACR